MYVSLYPFICRFCMPVLNFEWNVGIPRNTRGLSLSRCLYVPLFFMSAGSARFSYVGLVTCQHQRPTLRLSCCPKTGFMASKSKSLRSLNTQKTAKERKNKRADICPFLTNPVCRSFICYVGWLYAITQSFEYCKLRFCDLETHTSNAEMVDKSQGYGT